MHNYTTSVDRPLVCMICQDDLAVCFHLDHLISQFGNQKKKLSDDLSLVPLSVFLLVIAVVQWNTNVAMS